MKKIQLLTKHGQFVAEVTVPPFELMPEVIMWGDRFFVLNSHGEYREGMCYAVINTL